MSNPNGRPKGVKNKEAPIASIREEVKRLRIAVVRLRAERNLALMALGLNSDDIEKFDSLREPDGSNL